MKDKFLREYIFPICAMKRQNDVLKQLSVRFQLDCLLQQQNRCTKLISYVLEMELLISMYFRLSNHNIFFQRFFLINNPTNSKKANTVFSKSLFAQKAFLFCSVKLTKF